MTLSAKLVLKAHNNVGEMVPGVLPGVLYLGCGSFCILLNEQVFISQCQCPIPDVITFIWIHHHPQMGVVNTNMMVSIIIVQYINTISPKRKIFISNTSRQHCVCV